MLCVKCRRSHKADRTCEEVMSDEQRIAERKMKRIAQIHNLVVSFSIFLLTEKNIDSFLFLFFKMFFFDDYLRKYWSFFD